MPQTRLLQQLLIFTASVNLSHRIFFYADIQNMSLYPFKNSASVISDYGAADENENANYLSEQLITYLGNKRALLDFIGSALNDVQKRLNVPKMRLFDVFSGSGIVSRYLKKRASFLMANDLELYSRIINTCYLSNSSERDMVQLRGYFCALKEELDDCEFSGEWKKGIIAKLYAPANEKRITKKDRVFYTKRNALYIDTARTLIETYPEKIRSFFIAPLLAEASVHANTSGVFKGFYKNRETGIGQFGGKNGDALKRITGDIDLDFPVFSNFDCETLIKQEDANTLALTAPEVDVAYVDPPYNQHPYGSNYFMLNLIAQNTKPHNPSRVSGIPTDWNRSSYNQIQNAEKTLMQLVERLKAKFVLISFNSEGFIKKERMCALLKKKGKLTISECPYNAFRASRNLNKRSKYVKEYLFLLEKK